MEGQTKNAYLYGGRDKFYKDLGGNTMTKEKLKALLDAGNITQEEYDELLEKYGLNENPEPQPEDDPEPEDNGIDLDEIDKIVQRKLDKAMAQERKEKAELKRKYERLQKANLSAEEIKKEEMEEKEKAIRDREKAITDRENRLYAVKAIKEAGLDDGSDVSLALVDFVMGEDETEIDEKIKSFKELFNKAVTSEVNKRFKENGYTPKKGDNLNGGVNPYSKEQFSLTEQMRLEVENPELAKQLQSAAR